MAESESTPRKWFKTHRAGGQCLALGCQAPSKTRGYCGTHYSRIRLGKPLEDPLVVKGLRVEKACAACGSVMKLRPAIAKEQVFCSRACSNVSRPSARARLGYCRWCHGESTRVVKRDKDAGLYCSPACYTKKKKHVAAERAALSAIASNWLPRPNPLVVSEMAALARISRRPVVARLTYRPCANGCGQVMHGYMEYSRTCAPCKAEIVRAKRKTDAHKARKRIEKGIRRARTRAAITERIDPKQLFAKDGWKCYLCGIDTPMSLMGTNHGDAPTVDHVVPLARGGHHVWSNVRCACRSCNSRKSDKHYESMGYGGSSVYG